MTGDYFCLVDADDEIRPQYVSKMAGWLDEHDAYEWAACSYRTYSTSDDVTTIGAVAKYAFTPDTDNLMEKCILRQTITTVWIYMSRVRYVRKCKMIENWNTARNITYEPLIGIPLMNGVGRLKSGFMPLEHGESGVALMKEIKKSLDPSGMLNKGGLGL